MQYLAGIDIGTTGTKCGIFLENGMLVGNGYREYSCTYPHPNWVEQDPVMILEMTFEATKEALQNAGIPSKEIAAISLSSQRTSAIFLDENERPLKMISWQDNRAVEELEDILKFIDANSYYAITGLPLNSTWIAVKLLWMRKHEPKMMERTKKIVQVQDYILRHLGADNYYIDIPDAVLYGLWDTDHFTWSERLLKDFDVTPTLLPFVRRPGSIVGSISQEASEKSGFAVGTPIVVGAGDQNAAALGAGIIKPGIASVSIGTGGMSTVLLDKPYRDPAGGACITAHALAGKWQFEGYQVGAAGVLRWFRDEFATEEKHKFGIDFYGRLDEQISNIPAGARGLLFLPYFGGSAAPHWDPAARGTLIGLTFAHDRACVARAFIEGITMEQKDILYALKRYGLSVSRVRAMGGAAKSRIWCQIQADMYGIPVETLKVPDAALLGAAIFAGVGAGIFSDIKDAAEKMVNVDKTYLPNQRNTKRYLELYALYDQTYNVLKGANIYKQIASIQAKWDEENDEEQ